MHNINWGLFTRLKHEALLKYKEARENLQLDAGVGGGDVLEQGGRVLADDRLGVVAADVVPLEPVLVHVVEHAEARLRRLVDVELGVVRLRLLEVAGRAPRLVRPAGRRAVGGRELDARAGPEPAVDDERLQVVAVAALEVAQAPARPDVGQFLCCAIREGEKRGALSTIAQISGEESCVMMNYRAGGRRGPCRSPRPSRC